MPNSIFYLPNTIYNYLAVAKDFILNWRPDFFIPKLVGGFISLWLIFLIVIIIKKKMELTPKVATAEAGPEKIDKITKEWQKITQDFQKGDEANLKLAIIEADKLLDDILKKANFQGVDMGARLENINAAQISCIDDIWRAHRIRNKIAHETNFVIKRDEAEVIIKVYERALEELQVL